MLDLSSFPSCLLSNCNYIRFEILVHATQRVTAIKKTDPWLSHLLVVHVHVYITSDSQFAFKFPPYARYMHVHEDLFYMYVHSGVPPATSG